jgi:hypothetical protein
VLDHPLDGVTVLMGGVGVLGRPELRAKRKGGRRRRRTRFIGDMVESGGWVASDATQWRGVGAWGQRGGRAARCGRQRPGRGARGRCTREQQQNMGGRGLIGVPLLQS